MLQPVFPLVRHALKQLRESPGFALTAILTLTLGIGASTAIFAVLDAVMLQPLPFAQPDRLMALGQPDQAFAIPTLKDYQARSTTFTSVAGFSSWSPTQKTTDGIAAHRILVVTQGFFSTLGTRFAQGGSWPISSNEQDCASQAIVSGGYWKRLGGGTSLGNRKLSLDGRDFQIAAVLPMEQAIEGIGELNQPEVFVPVGCDSQERPSARGDQSFEAIGRLKTSVTAGQAQADIARVDETLRKDYPNYYGAYRARFRQPTLVKPYLDLLIGTDTRPALFMTLAACGMLLLIACANLANLLLARNTRRRGEFAVRATLGASLGMLLQQLFVESLALVVFGAGGGIALALFLVKTLKTIPALHLPRLANASMSPAVLVFSVLLSVVVTFLLALLPAWRTLRPELLRDLQGAGRSSASRSLRFAGRLLVVTQLTFTMVLVACAGWMVGGVYLLLHQPLGFSADRLLMVRALVHPDRPSGEHAPAESELELTQIAASLRHLPGVEDVALTDHQPLGHATNRYDFCSDMHLDECQQQVNLNPNSYAISPGYFKTIGQSLIEGRDFNAADDGRAAVVIVNQTLAAREWPGQSAIGHHVHTGELRAADHSMSVATVVGVVGNIHNYDLVSAPGPDIYIPRAENPNGYARIMLSVSGDPSAMKNTIETTLKSSFPGDRFWNYETMGEEMSGEVSERAFLMQVAIAFGSVALFLSILGTYGLLAYEVSLRDKEIGIRLALGSSRERIVTLLLHQEGRWLLAGTLLGLSCAAMTGYAFRSNFYGAQTNSLAVLTGTATVLLVPALLAIALPSRRAALQDPAQTLRRE